MIKHILKDYDYLEYDEAGSSGIVKLCVKVICLDAERDIAVIDHITRKLSHATGRYYVSTPKPRTGSPSEDSRNKGWTYFTLHEKNPPRRNESK